MMSDSALETRLRRIEHALAALGVKLDDYGLRAQPVPGIRKREQEPPDEFPPEDGGRV